MTLQKLFGTEIEGLQNSGATAIDQQVCATEQSLEVSAPFIAFQVQHDAALVRVVRSEIQADIRVQWLLRATGHPLWRLDENHFGAKVGKNPRSHVGLAVGQFDHPHASKGGLVLSVGHLVFPSSYCYTRASYPATGNNGSRIGLASINHINSNIIYMIKPLRGKPR